MDISNGLILNENTTSYLSEYVKAIKVELAEEARRAYLIDIAKAAQSIYISMFIDIPVNLMNPCLSDSELARAVGKNPKTHVWNKRMISAQKIFNIARDLVDSKRVNYPLKPYIVLNQEMASFYNASINVYPIEGKTLIAPDAYNPNYLHIIKGSIHTKPYHYWDGADEEYMESNWEQKKKDWQDAFSHPVENHATKKVEYGFSVQLINGAKDIDITTDRLLKDSIPYMNSDFGIVEKAMKIKIQNEYLAEIQDGNPNNEAEMTWSQIVKNMDQALKMYDENLEENQKRIREVAKSINTIEFFKNVLK